VRERQGGRVRAGLVRWPAGGRMRCSGPMRPDRRCGPALESSSASTRCQSSFAAGALRPSAGAVSAVAGPGTCTSRERRAAARWARSFRAVPRRPHAG
jgi:hypothetical protein